MALGDLSNFSSRNSAVWAKRIDGEIDGNQSGEDILSKSIFRDTEIEVGRADHAAAPNNWFQRYFHRASPRVGGGKVSLTSLMNDVHDVMAFGTENDIEWINVPFPHVVFLLSEETPEYRRTTEARIATLLRNEWADLIDPLIELRVLMLLGRDVERGKIVGFFGRGVFAPSRNERQLGRVEVALAGEVKGTEPALGGEVPAGLYRGQVGLAFAASEQFAPAVSNTLPPNGLFLLRGAGPGDPRGAVLALDWQPAGSGHSFMPGISSHTSDLYDVVFQIDSGEGSAVEVRVIEDVRPSRLLAFQPKTRFCLEIVGIIAPEPTADFLVNRWWIDLDRNGALVSSALRERATTIVCERGQLFAYDWENFGRRLDGEASARLIDLETESGRCKALCAVGGVFGYLRPPSRATEVSFGQSRASTDFDSVYELDWLDFSGAVETPSLFALRLGDFSKKYFDTPIQIPGVDSKNPASSGGLFRPGGDEKFTAQWDGVWKAGVELIVGPLLLRISDAEASE